MDTRGGRHEGDIDTVINENYSSRLQETSSPAHAPSRREDLSTQVDGDISCGRYSAESRSEVWECEHAVVSHGVKARQRARHSSRSPLATPRPLSHSVAAMRALPDG